MLSVDHVEATVEEISEAINWVSDCLGLTCGARVSAGRAMAYVGNHYPGGWQGFVAEAMVSVQL